MNFKQLKTHLYNRISSLTDLTVYNGSSPSLAIFPYVTFVITSSFEVVRGRSDKILELDYWTDSNNDSILLDEAEKVKQGLNYMWQSENDGFLSSYLEFEAEIPNQEKNISHINQRYVLKVR